MQTTPPPPNQIPFTFSFLVQHLFKPGAFKLPTLFPRQERKSSTSAFCASSSLMCCPDNLIHICFSTTSPCPCPLPLHHHHHPRKCIEDKQEKIIVLQHVKSSKFSKSGQIYSWDTLSSTQFYYIQVTYAAHLVHKVSHCFETQVEHKTVN